MQVCIYDFSRNICKIVSLHFKIVGALTIKLGNNKLLY